MPIDRAYATEHIDLFVRGGFHAPDWIEERVREDCFLPADVTPVDAQWLGTEVARLWAAKLLDEASWPSVTDCDRLDNAFAALEAAGIIALHDAGTEPSDGFTEVAEVYHAIDGNTSGAIGFCFYHQQDVEIAIKGHGLAIFFGDIDRDPASTVAIGQRVVAELNRAGLTTAWNGQADRIIELPTIVWRRRYRP
jgi:hypothetical protein